MKTFFRALGILIILAIFGGTLYYLFQKSQDEPQRFGTDTPSKTSIIKKTVANGSVVPRNEVEVKPQISGIVKELFVQPGEVVKDGDLLARIKIIPDMVTLNNAETRLNQSELEYENAKRQYERYKKLYEDGVVSESEFQQYELSVNTAREEVEAAKENLQLIKEGVTKRSGNTTNTLIRATINGMVLDVPVEVGNSVIESNNFNEGTTIASIADMGEMVFEGKVDESEVGKLKEGMDLILTIGAIDNKKFDAKLEYIAPKGVEENGAIQFEIKAAVDKDTGSFIRAGYSATADIVLAKKDSVMAISESLVKFDEKGPYVEVLAGEQTFEKRHIETGLSDGINIEVTDGLEMDTKIKNPNKLLTEKGED